MSDTVKVDLSQPLENSVADTVKVDLSTQNETVNVDTPVVDEPPVKKPQRQSRKALEPEVYKVDLRDYNEAPVLEDTKPIIDQPAQPNESVEDTIVVDEVVDAPVLDTDDVYAGYGLDDDASVPADSSTVEEDDDQPENVKDLIRFLKDTNGTVEDYVRLNSDYSNTSEDVLLKEYYKKTKPHLDNEEIDFLIEDSFSYDEDYDDPKDIRKKKLLAKEELSKARKYLEDIKKEYYKEIKSNAKLSTEQKEAIDFYNTYKENTKVAEENNRKNALHFNNETKKVFENFKGFEFNVGDQKFSYNVKNPKAVMDYQSDISNFVKEFLGDNNAIKDARGYHKALFAAKNADTLASHFYEQGKADAIREVTAKSKNIDMNPRGVHQNDGISSNGIKVRSLETADNSRLKIKINR
jgi:hypothetical protein